MATKTLSDRKSLDQQQAERNERAVTGLATWRFRVHTLKGVLKATNERFEQIAVHVRTDGGDYYVSPELGFCGCKDHERHPELQCKHLVAASLFLASQPAPAPTPSLPEQIGRHAAALADRAKLWD